MTIDTEFIIPGEAPSTPNLREHWAAKSKRIAAQRAKVKRRAPEWTVPSPVVITLTRVAPRELDDDNVRGALKAHRDAVAAWLRVDDRTPLIEWKYAQAKGEPAVKVSVRAMVPHG